MDQHEEEQTSPKKARIAEGPPTASIPSPKPQTREQILKATQEILERQSVEESVLVGRGEDSSVSFGTVPVFTRPLPAGRSRSSTCTSGSGTDTPPLSSDGSSISGGSQSSIDLAHLNSLLADSSRPLVSNGNTARRTRLRARGQGHRHRNKRFSYTHDEVLQSDKPQRRPVIIVTPSSMDLTADGSFWDSERGIEALDRYYALRNEAEDAVIQSKQIWSDTPFSLYAVQNFRPPRHPEGMKALLQQSVQNFGPLPSELRRRHSRTLSRPSPYPLSRVSRVFHAPESESDSPPVLQDIRGNSNVPPSPAPSFTFKAFSPEKQTVKRAAPFGHSAVRPRVGSSTRRVPSGGAKPNAKSSNGHQKENKENVLT